MAGLVAGGAALVPFRHARLTVSDRPRPHARIGRHGHPLPPRGLPRAAVRGAGRPPGGHTPAGLAGEADRARHGHQQVLPRRRRASCPNQYDAPPQPGRLRRPSRRIADRWRTTWHTACSARARHERYTLVARPRVQILSDPSVPRRRRPRGGQRRRRRGCAASGTTSPRRRRRTRWSSRGPASDAPPPDSAQRAYLLVQTDGAPPVQFDLGGALISIGRASDNDVIVDDPLVSRHHCQLKLQHGAYGFADLGSRNGSWVNGAAGQRGRAGAGRPDPHRHRRTSSSRCADDR